MSNFKDWVPNLMGVIKQGRTATTKGNSDPLERGKLSSDALPVNDDDLAMQQDQQSMSNDTPTPSTELTESVVRELSNPNYSSMEGAAGGMGQSSMVMSDSIAPLLSPVGSTAVAAPFANGNVATGNSYAATSNTMNVTNAQSLTMQFNNASNLHFGSVYNIQSPISSGKAVHGGTGNAAITAGGSVGRKQGPRKTVSIVMMMTSQEELNHHMMDCVATHLGEGWRSVMRELGLSDGQMEQAVIDHHIHGGIKEVIYQCLLQWQRNADDGEATLGHLVTRLWELQQRDVVHRMKVIWKSQSNRKTSL